MLYQNLQEEKSFISGFQVKVPDDCAYNQCMWAGEGLTTAPCIILISLDSSMNIWQMLYLLLVNVISLA